MSKKRIVFLTGTRADFGKLKPLIDICQHDFEVHIFATGMHLQPKYGYTVDEIEKCGYQRIYKFINFCGEESMDQILANTVGGFSSYVKLVEPDLIVVHGDRVEPLAGAIVGTLNNVLVSHLEGGEISGTVDEILRHSISKLAHMHFVSNDLARLRLMQMGELEDRIFVIGSPDLDVMLSAKLPEFSSVLAHYEIPFCEYGILLFHPVTTEVAALHQYAVEVVRAAIASKDNYVVVYPNNDLGSSSIFLAYEELKSLPHRFRIFPSIRFENFLVLMKHARYILGNSSAGIREAPAYGVPTVNIGTRQQNRSLDAEIINVGYNSAQILAGIARAKQLRLAPKYHFGTGKSAQLFLETLHRASFWKTNMQKFFQELPLGTPAVAVNE